MEEGSAIRTTIPDIAGRFGTREKLMMAGEELIGSRGYDTVPLEEIARSCGQGNKYAVQYHFADRGGLAQAILDLRLSQIDRRRSDLIKLTNADDPASIMASFIVPLSEQVDAAGRCSFARFILHYAIQIRPWLGISHPLASIGGASGTHSLFDLLCRALPHIDRELLGTRLILLMTLPLSLLSSRSADSSHDENRRALADVAEMMAASLAAGTTGRSEFS